MSTLARTATPAPPVVLDTTPLALVWQVMVQQVTPLEDLLDTELQTPSTATMTAESMPVTLRDKVTQLLEELVTQQLEVSVTHRPEELAILRTPSTATTMAESMPVTLRDKDTQLPEDSATQQLEVSVTRQLEVSVTPLEVLVTHRPEELVTLPTPSTVTMTEGLMLAISQDKVTLQPAVSATQRLEVSVTPLEVLVTHRPEELVTLPTLLIVTTTAGLTPMT
jgi:hypothetical protein